MGQQNSEPVTIADGLSYTECPRWHEGRLWFSDFYTYRVYSMAEDGADLRIEAQVPEQPSGLGWLPDGRLLIVSMRDARLLRREPDGTLVTHAELAAHVSGHPNDMVVDGAGRAYVGEFGFDLMNGAPFRAGVLLRVDPDGAVTRVADDLYFPNGSVITGDGVLLVDETFGNRITAFDIGAGGELTGRRVWAQFGPTPQGPDVGDMIAAAVVAPDGCGLDAEGGVWVADAVGARVVRVVDGGAITDEIAVPPGVFACMLGGADGRSLFLSVAPDFAEENRKKAREASVQMVRVTVPRASRP